MNQTASLIETPSPTEEVAGNNKDSAPSDTITAMTIHFEAITVEIPSNWEHTRVENIDIGIPTGWNELSIDELIGIVNLVFDSNEMSLIPVYAPNVDILIGNWLEFSGVGIVIDDLGLTLPRTGTFHVTRYLTCG